MSKKIRLSYADINNMGDQLNYYIVERVFGLKVIKSNRFNCQCLGIGSSLGGMLWDDKINIRILQHISRIFFGETHIWSSGFINGSHHDNPFFRKKVIFHAVRGELSKQRVEKILNRKLEIPTGDGGLLTSLLFDKPFSKKYSVGIIPHMREQSEPFFKELYNNIVNAKIIDLLDDPMSIVKDMAQCETIVSSSLHGLVVADSFGIPNKYVKVTDKPLGDGFKFRDYYSAFGLPLETYDIKQGANISIDEIIKDYKISKDDVELKKKQLYDCFPSL